MSAIIWKPKYNFISPQVPFEIIIERADGQTSKIPFEELVNNSTSFQLLPTIAQNYVSTIENKFLSTRFITPNISFICPCISSTIVL